MKKRIIVCLFVSLIAMSFAIPVMATEATVVKPVYESTGEEISPRNEMTRIYFRNHYGRLQFRVWSITNGRWITDWEYV